MKRSLADQLKFVTTKSKIKQERLSKIRKIIQGVPTKMSRYIGGEDEFERAYERGKIDLANQIRKVLNDDPFAGRDAYRPGSDETAILRALLNSKSSIFETSD